MQTEYVEYSRITKCELLPSGEVMLTFKELMTPRGEKPLTFHGSPIRDTGSGYDIYVY